jgi:hypothetical protein
MHSQRQGFPYKQRLTFLKRISLSVHFYRFKFCRFPPIRRTSILQMQRNRSCFTFQTSTNFFIRLSDHQATSRSSVDFLPQRDYHHRFPLSSSDSHTMSPSQRPVIRIGGVRLHHRSLFMCLKKAASNPTTSKTAALHLYTASTVTPACFPPSAFRLHPLSCRTYGRLAL